MLRVAGNVGNTIPRFATILGKICSLPRPQIFPAWESKSAFSALKSVAYSAKNVARKALKMP